MPAVGRLWPSDHDDEDGGGDHDDENGGDDHDDGGDDGEDDGENSRMMIIKKMTTKSQ